MAVSQMTTVRLSLDRKDHEEEVHLLQSGQDVLSSRKLMGHVWRLGCLCTIVNVTFTLLAAVLVQYYNGFSGARCDCSEKTLNTYSPVYDRLEIVTSKQHFSNTFWPDGGVPSVYQRAPSPEVDEAWARISDTHAFRLTREEAVAMGKDPETLWPWPLRSGTDHGNDREYMGMIDFFHQAHCLDNLRRAAWPSYYNISAIRESYSARRHPFPFDDHLLHCQHVLLRALMCHADVEVVTFNRVRGVRGPFANFAVDRTCRNFDALLAWKEEHSVTELRNGWDRFWEETEKEVVEIEAWDVKVDGEH
ncbi:hypothetical protein PG995_010355 [Apiospora arundinis]